MKTLGARASFAFKEMDALLADANSSDNDFDVAQLQTLLQQNKEEDLEHQDDLFEFHTEARKEMTEQMRQERQEVTEELLALLHAMTEKAQEEIAETAKAAEEAVTESSDALALEISRTKRTAEIEQEQSAARL